MRSKVSNVGATRDLDDERALTVETDMDEGRHRVQKVTAHLEYRVHEEVAGVPAGRHGRQLSVRGELELDVETQPGWGPPDRIPQGRCTNRNQS